MQMTSPRELVQLFLYQHEMHQALPIANLQLQGPFDLHVFDEL